MRRGWIAMVAAVAGCGDNLEPRGDDAPVRYDGGTIDVPSCGYTVTTPLGAEAPRPGTAVVGTDPTPRQVRLGIPGDPRTAIAIQWRTRDDTTYATTVRFAPGDALAPAALGQTLDGFTFEFEAPGTNPRIHEVHLCGLAPDTIYSYQVGSAVPGAEAWSPVYAFRTAPDVVATPDAELRVAVVGDSRSGYDVWATLVGLIAQRQPDLVLFTGDAVTEGDDQHEWDEFFDRAEPLFARVAVVAANGNHEANGVAFYAQFAQKGDEENFGFDIGWAHVSVANDSPAIAGDLEARIAPALEADLAASAGARWKLAMHHRTTFSAGTGHGSDLPVQRAFMPLYDRYDVDLVLNGHEHDFELTRPLVWDPATGEGVVAASAAEGTVFEVQGGAGAALHGNGTGFWTAYSESVHSASMLTIRRDQITLEAFRLDGTPIATGYTETKP